MRELVTTLTRQSRVSSCGISKPRKPGEEPEPYTGPLPFDPRVRKARDQIVSVLTTWMRDLDYGALVCIPDCTCRPYRACQGTGKRAPRTVAEWCQWLLERMSRIRSHKAAGEILRDLRRAVAAARHVIDRPPARLYVGPCAICKQDLYALDEEDEVICENCAEVVLAEDPDGYVPRYHAKTFRDALRSDLRGQVATRADILGGIDDFFEVVIREGAFDAWIRSGRLLAAGQRGGVSLYPIARVLELAELAAERRERKHKHKHKLQPATRTSS